MKRLAFTTVLIFFVVALMAQPGAVAEAETTAPIDETWILILAGLFFGIKYVAHARRENSTEKTIKEDGQEEACL